jgi:serine/threonine protein kinase
MGTNREISKELRSLIVAMLEKNPKSRIKTEELEMHSFIKS